MEKLLLPRGIIRNWLRRSMCTKQTPTQVSEASSGSMSPKYRPTELQKFILVWTKKYKSKAEIPATLPPETIDRARNEARIKLSNILMLLTALASFGFVLSGKAAAKRGESIHKMNQDFHKQYREEYEKNQAATDAKAN